MTTQPDLEAQLAAEREETERVFGAQARLYAAVSEALAGDSALIARPADDTYTCEECLVDISPADALTATWVERRMRVADQDWHPAGVDYITVACAACRDAVLDAVAARGAGQAELAASAHEPLSGAPLVTYLPGNVDWPSGDAG